MKKTNERECTRQRRPSDLSRSQRYFRVFPHLQFPLRPNYAVLHGARLMYRFGCHPLVRLHRSVNAWSLHHSPAQTRDRVTVSRSTSRKSLNEIGAPGGIRGRAKLASATKRSFVANPRPSGSKYHESVRSNAYLRLLLCKRLQWAEIDCTGDGPTALYGPRPARSFRVTSFD